MIDVVVISDIFSAAFSVLYVAVILTTIFIVILENRNPVKTMAWILVLFFLPIVGLVFYFFFGRSTRKEHLITRKGYARISYAYSVDHLETAVHRIHRFLEAHGWLPAAGE